MYSMKFGADLKNSVVPEWAPGYIAYDALKAQITAAMPPAKRPGMDACFEKLMHEVTRSLASRNRDRFTQNLTVFRHEAKR